MSHVKITDGSLYGPYVTQHCPSPRGSWGFDRGVLALFFVEIADFTFDRLRVFSNFHPLTAVARGVLPWAIIQIYYVL